MNENFTEVNSWPSYSSINKETTEKMQTSNFKQAMKFFKNKDYKKALKYLNKILEHNPSNLKTHHYLSLLHLKTQNLNQAIVHLYEIVNSKQSYKYLENALILLSYTYNLQKDYDNAKNIIEKIPKKSQNNIILSIKGYIEYSKKNYKQAKKHYEKILETDQNNPQAYNNLGMIYIESKEDIKKGIEYCKKAIKLKPNHSAYLDSLGWGYYKLKNYEESVKYLRKALEKDVENKEIKNHLKIVLNI